MTARTKKSAKITKEEVINVRCTEQQQEALKVAAAREGLGVSTWLLRLGLVEVVRQEREERR